MRASALLGFGLLALLPVLASAEPARKELNSVADINRALRACWRWPPRSEARAGMELRARLSFRRNGEVFGIRVTYQTPNVSDEERALYYRALLAALSRCSPLPLSESLGEAIAGRPLNFHIHDTRHQRKV